MNREDATKDIAHYLSLPYTIILRPDGEGDLVARVQELPGCVAHGQNEKEALDNLRTVQQAWIQECLDSEQSVPVPEPEEELPSGKFLVRVARSLHKRLTELADKEGVSLNQLVASILSEGIGTKSVALSFSAAQAHADLTWLFAEWDTDKELYGEWHFGQSVARQGDLLSTLRNVKRIVPRLTVKSISDADTKEIEAYFHPHSHR